MQRRDTVVDFGGDGPPILLLHGLMGRARTWCSVAQWLKPYGHVVALDAAGHGRAAKTGPWETERFVEDVLDTIRHLDEGPAILIGHSMGGLHAWGAAAAAPELVRAVVSEDIAPDQVGKTVDQWRAYFDSWPLPFESLAHVRAFFGDLGDYFTECVVEREDGFHLAAELDDLYQIAAEWGVRDYWSTVDAVKCPLLLIEGGRGSMPPGQQEQVAARAADGRHVLVPDAHHVAHLAAPRAYRGAVEAFLSEVLSR